MTYKAGDIVRCVFRSDVSTLTPQYLRLASEPVRVSCAILATNLSVIYEIVSLEGDIKGFAWTDEMRLAAEAIGFGLNGQ